MFKPEEYVPASYVKYKFKTPPFEHQKKFLAETWMKPYYALFWEMGSGKSFTTINNAGILFKHGLINGMLVIAPKGVYRNWTTLEIPTHMPEHIPYETMYWNSNGTRKYSFALSEFIHTPTPGKLDIFAINIDALITKKGFQACETFLNTHTALTVVDESTRIKSPSAMRTKRAIQLAKLSKYRRILTGTPITTSPLDIYSQVDFLDPAELNLKKGIQKNNPLGFCNFTSFRARYALLKEIPGCGKRPIKFPVAYINQDELHTKLKAFSSRLTKEECLDLPPKIYKTWEVELTDEQKRLYTQMATEARAILWNARQETEEIYAQTALTQLLRLHQLSCGFISSQDGSILEVKNNRLQELMNVIDIADKQEGKVIIWSNFVPAIEAIISEIKAVKGEDSVVHFYGATSDEERERAKKDFQDPDSPVKYFVGNPSSAGMGITLTQATTVIYYSNSFNLEHRLQSEDRAHRAGQHHPVTYIDFVSTPLDMKVIQKLIAKKNTADLVVDGEFNKWLGGE